MKANLQTSVARLSSLEAELVATQQEYQLAVAEKRRLHESLSALQGDLNAAEETVEDLRAQSQELAELGELRIAEAKLSAQVKSSRDEI